MRDASITTDAPSADGGNIAIQVADRLTLADSEISANVGGGVGGNITIDPVLVFLDGSRILAQAREGQGGRIQISARVFLASVDSLVSASSALGIDGSVTIRAPDTDLSGTLSPLPESFLDVASQMRAQCAARSPDQGGSFAVRGRDGAPPSPDGLLPAWTPAEVMREFEGATAPDERVTGGDDLVGAVLRESASGEILGFFVGCRA
jgi:large exoprotein involved in heme utilization and adhesion